MKLILVQFLMAFIIGEYVVSGKSELTKDELKIILKNSPPDVIRVMGGGKYLLKYKKDPGLKQLNKIIQKPNLIQPNYTYKAI